MSSTVVLELAPRSLRKSVKEKKKKKNISFLSNVFSLFSKCIAFFCINFFLEIESRQQKVCTA